MILNLMETYLIKITPVFKNNIMILLLCHVGSHLENNLTMLCHNFLNGWSQFQCLSGSKRKNEKIGKLKSNMETKFLRLEVMLQLSK